METKETPKQKQKRYQRLKILRSQMENGYVDAFGVKIKPDENVVSLLKWYKMNSSEKSECYKVWDKYYDGAQKTRAYQIYAEIKTLFQSRKQTGIFDKKRFSELLQESAAMAKEQEEEGRLEIPKPNQVNPYKFLNQTSVARYQYICSEIAKMEFESRNAEGLSGIF